MISKLFLISDGDKVVEKDLMLLIEKFYSPSDNEKQITYLASSCAIALLLLHNKVIWDSSVDVKLFEFVSNLRELVVIDKQKLLTLIKNHYNFLTRSPEEIMNTLVNANIFCDIFGISSIYSKTDIDAINGNMLGYKLAFSLAVRVFRNKLKKVMVRGNE